LRLFSPTRNRPDLVLRAVRGALAQEYEDMEVIVVIDGPDTRTAGVLNEIHDRRSQVIALAEATGAANTRNAGVANAAGDRIAFLNDDDE
jgi:glycosyltransferase involved in cell wall biosynthesis